MDHTNKNVQAHYAQLAQHYDNKANKACKHYYEQLVTRTLQGQQRILELGAGSSSLLPHLDAPLKIACDLSHPMLSAHPPTPGILRLVADAQQLPLQPQSLDAIYSINVIEHTPDLNAVIQCAATLLQPSGLFLALTPNGNLEGLLNLLERLKLKLPEGPHQFRTIQDCANLAGTHFTILEHNTCLALPAGPPALVTLIDKIAPFGLFQYIILQKNSTSS